MGLLLVLQLQTVLDRPQEAVGVVELRRLVGLDVPAGGELRERVERGGGADGRVVPAVHELEELHRELDVADAAAPPLHLAVREAAALHLSLRPGLHGPHRANRVRVEDLRPDDGLHQLEESTTDVAVACDGPGLQERLELPRLRPALVVRAVRLQRARQRSRSAFGTEVGVGAEDDAVGGGLAHGREHRPRGAFGDGAVTLVDEQHVDVARVVELAAAELPHRDDLEPDVRGNEVERAAEAHLGQGRQLPADGGKVGHAE